MGFISKLNKPVVMKTGTSAREQIQKLKQLQKNASPELKKQLERDIAITKYGLDGENSVLYELQNSHMPMYILQDLYFVNNDLKAQIDFLIITEKLVLVLECKNLYGNISIDQDGNFIRITKYNGEINQEGMYSPYTQNQRHLALIRDMCITRLNAFQRLGFQKKFEKCYKSIIVLANPKTVVNRDSAPENIQNIVVRADNLINYIKNLHQNTTGFSMSEKEMKELADFFLEKHVSNYTDYTAKYKKIIGQTNCFPSKTSASKAMLCEKCGKPMTLKESASGKFWGCTGFPQCRYTKSYITETTAKTMSTSTNIKKSASKTMLCEKCGKPMALKESASGKFWGCTGFPQCRYTKTYTTTTTGKNTSASTNIKKPASKTMLCEKCGKPMTLKESASGKFWGCTGFPQCRYTKSYTTETTANIKKSISKAMLCEKCGKPMALKESKNGKFWGCTGFPNCRNTKNI